MKVTFLLTQSLESPSGAGRYWPIAKGLARLGYEVTILALHHNYRALKQRHFLTDGVKVHYIGQMHVRKVGNQKFYFNPVRLIWISLVATLQLTQMALRVPSDVYHICKPHPMNGIAGLIAKYTARKHIFLDCDDYESFSNRFAGIWQQQVVAYFENRLPIYTTGITTNTHFMMKRLESLGYPCDRIIYVPNGVDRERFQYIDFAEVESLRKRLNLYGHKVILYVGSMSLVSHAVDLLLEAFAIVHQYEKRAVLVLVGGGEDYEKLKSQSTSLGLSPYIRFVGRVPSDLIPFYYHLADVSVDPVHNDIVAKSRSPLKIFESLAAGVPVVTGNVGDRCQYLGMGKAGKLVIPGDPHSLATGILEILQNPGIAMQMRQAAESLREKYYWDVLVKDFAKLYEFLV
ncbi:MAG: glycosyltransferase family 4 protein [Candidatus Methanomethyliaceae archaeon]